MKSIRYISIFFFIFLFINSSFAFTDRRYQYWNIRLKTLNNEMEELQNNPGTPGTVIGLTKSDIVKARDMLRFFENSLGDDTDKFEKQNYNENEVRTEITKILAPLFSLTYLEFILENTGRNGSYQLAKENVRKNINAEIHNHFSEYNDILCEKILRDRFTNNDWKFLAAEAWLGLMMRNRDRLFSKTASEVEKKITPALKKSGYSISPKDLYNLVESASGEILLNTNFLNTIDHETNPLQDAWSWNEKQKIVSRYIINRKITTDLLEKAGIKLQPDDTEELYKDITGLEEMIFTKIAENNTERINELLKSSEYINCAQPQINNSFFLTIPAIPDLSQMLSDLDTIHKTTIKDINGLEEESFFNDLKAALNNMVKERLSGTAAAFLEQEKKFKDAKKDYENQVLPGNAGNNLEFAGGLFYYGWGLNIMPANKPEFDKSKTIFEKQEELVKAYINDTVKFAKLISGIKMLQKPGPALSIQDRIMRNSQYIEYLANQAEDCAGLETLTEPSLHKRYHSVTVRISGLYSLLGYSLDIEKRIIESMNPGEVSGIIQGKTQLSDLITAAGSKIRGVYTAIMRHRQDKIMKLKSLNYNTRNRIAEHELNIIMQAIDEYMTAYATLDYCREAFRNYSEKYRSLEEEIKAGEMPGSFNNILKSRSLLPLLKEFDAERIKREYDIKQHLKNTIYKNIAAVRTLANTYKRKNLEIDRSISGRMSSVMERLRIKEEVKIGSWIMNETNFKRLDQKAFQKLYLSMKKNFWMNKNNRDKQAALESSSITLPELKINVTIPEGWSEQNIDPSESDRGIIKSFKSFDGHSCIYLACIDKKNENEKAAAESWIKNMKSRKVLQRWGKKDKMDYYWALSSADNNLIIESYAISCGTKTLIISGVVPKGKYNFFKKKMTSVFQSISII